MKKYFKLVITIPLLILISYLLYPLPLDKNIKNNTDLTIVYNPSSAGDNLPFPESNFYDFKPSSEKFKEIQNLLNSYSYHYCFKSIYKNSTLQGNNVGYWLQIYSDENTIILNGTSNILINGRIYSVGYWDDNKTTLLMNEIINILKDE